jgi:hypothetical protein
MDKPKRWYNPEAVASVRVVPRDDPNEPICSIRWRHPRIDPNLWECLRYPLADAPGIGLLFLFPPILWALSLPIFDIIAVLQPITKGNWKLGLLVVPVMIPVGFSFAMVFGYAIVFLGHVLVASSLGENDHPSWPEWHPADIAEGIFRWIWATIVGLLIGAVPLVLYWVNCGEIDVFDCLIFSGLIMLASGFGQMALAAALLHENIIAANPITVVVAIFRIGWAYLWPCLLAGIALAFTVLGVFLLLYKMPQMWMEAVALWTYWVLVFYLGMVSIRMMGLTYHAHAPDLAWFRRRPRWATTRHRGQLYANS